MKLATLLGLTALMPLRRGASPAALSQAPDTGNEDLARIHASRERLIRRIAAERDYIWDRVDWELGPSMPIQQYCRDLDKMEERLLKDSIDAQMVRPL